LYEFDLAPEATTSIAALPVIALAPLAEVFAMLKVSPWSGAPHHENNPSGAMRHQVFGPDGAGDVTYVVLERTRQVHVVRIIWLGD
jgi:hypothetical protein